jgi:ADP-heptose:LPS heptosyltransferase
VSGRILVVLPEDIPGIVLAEPTLRNLKKNLPKAPLLAAVRAKFLPLVSKMSYFDEIIVYQPFSPTSILKFKNARIYRSILLNHSACCALWLYFAGINKRVGYRRFGFSWTMNRKVKKLPEKIRDIRIREMIELIRFFGCQIENRIPLWPEQGEKKGAKLILTKSPYETISPGILEKWTDQGYQLLQDSKNLEERYQQILSASFVVGPPDSEIVLAEACGIPCLRLSNRKIRYDEFPGQHSCVLPLSTSPEEALRRYHSELDL